MASMAFGGAIGWCLSSNASTRMVSTSKRSRSASEGCSTSIKASISASARLRSSSDLTGNTSTVLDGRGVDAVVFGMSPHESDEHDRWSVAYDRSEEHTSELQSPCNLVCRLLLEKKK